MRGDEPVTSEYRNDPERMGVPRMRGDEPIEPDKEGLATMRGG